MIVEKYIREMYSALDEPRSVVIVSPDHFSTGEFTISTPSENEHGFTIHRDLVSEYFGLNAYGIMLRSDVTSEELIEVDYGDALMIFSIDFSHYLPGSLARVHDVLARDVIESRSVEEARKLEVDSPAAVELMLRILEQRGEKMLLLKNTNPSWDAGIESFENTTHFFGCAVPGEPSERGIRVSAFFEHPRDWYLGKTQEDRYLYGYDEVTFDTGVQDHALIGDEAVYFDIFEQDGQ
jgi:hypothetical protein